MTAVHYASGRHAQLNAEVMRSSSEKIPTLPAQNTGSATPGWWHLHAGHPAQERWDKTTNLDNRKELSEFYNIKY